MILARLLTPYDYGIISMVAVLMTFANMFSNLGLSTATIQRREINDVQVSTLFWVNAILGLLIALLIAATSPLLAWFYNAPELAWVTIALSTNFVILGLMVQHQALLTRQMLFYTLAKVHIFSSLIGVSVAILTALNGYRYWSLVFNVLTSSLSRLILFWLYSKWRPGPPRRHCGVRPMLKFGSDIVGFNIFNYFGRNLDNILIGRYCGSGALGVYSKAYQLLMMPITNIREPLNRVCMPALSRLQNDPEQYRNYYMKYLSILSLVSMPLVAFLFSCSDKIISLVLGSQWMQAAEIFRILALVAFIQPVASSRGMVLLSIGDSRRYLTLGAATAFLVSMSFLIGIHWGARGIAVAYAISIYTIVFPFLYLSFRKTPIRVSDFISAVRKPLVASLIMGSVCYLIILKLKSTCDSNVLMVCLPVSVLIYIGSIILFSGGLKDFRELYEYGKLVFVKVKAE